MTEQRAQAYGRVMRTLADMGPSKLLPREQELLREAADAMLFCDDPADVAVLEAARDAELLVQHLVECERWDAERAEQLARDVSACGPERIATPC
jgi:hypothetical protein